MCLKTKRPALDGVKLAEYFRLLFEHVALPYQDVLFRVRMHRYGEGGGIGSSGSFLGEDAGAEATENACNR